MNFILEVIAFTIESCIIAQRAGAHRIELCDNPSDGGTTPSYGMIKAAREKTNLELFPIIRPRGGDFLYRDDEFEIMKRDIKCCKDLGCEGVVTGMLRANGTVDKDRMSRLVDIAYPLSVTFHRAFDRVNGYHQALEDIISVGCERILTSGLRPTAMEGVNVIKELVSVAKGRIMIMPGSGVRSTNVLQLAAQTGTTEFHTSGRILVDSKMQFNNPDMKEKLITPLLDEKEVKEILSCLELYFSKNKMGQTEDF
jgi:copper homeostasis protein